jgi:hypothetical protein
MRENMANQWMLERYVDKRGLPGTRAEYTDNYEYVQRQLLQMYCIRLALCDQNRI